MSASEAEQPSGVLRRVVSDTGPMISLERLTGGFRFIRRLYDRIIVPPSVLEELGFGYDRAEAYLEHYGINDLIEVRSVAAQAALPDLERLHEGEIQAIRLALELGVPLLIEEAAAGGRLRRRAFRFQVLRDRSSKPIARESSQWKRRELC